MRYRATVRGEGIELRGYFDDSDRADEPSRLVEFCDAVRPYGVVLVSPAEPSYDPFGGVAEVDRWRVACSEFEQSYVAEHDARLEAEAQVRELEAELKRREWAQHA